jgi:uncharacterized protein (DUF2141 family)
MRSHPILAAALLLAPPLLLAPATARAADLAVTVEGVRNATGVVYVCLWSAALTYPDCAKSVPHARRAIPPEGGTARTVFDGLPPGTYAISVLHDENGNGVMDSSWLGVPREGFGFSRIPRLVAMRAPTFEEASFRVEADGSVTVTMIYF